MSLSRVTVTLPEELVAEIDRAAPNRSRFVAEAVTRELARRRRAVLSASLPSPHPETLAVAEAGVAEWGRSLPTENAESLLEPSQGKRVEWVDGRGWTDRDR